MFSDPNPYSAQKLSKMKRATFIQHIFIECYAVPSTVVSGRKTMVNKTKALLWQSICSIRVAYLVTKHKMLPGHMCIEEK